MGASLAARALGFGHVLHRVSILGLDGVTDSGVSIALDVLRAANAVVSRRTGRPAFLVELLSRRGRRLTLSSGLRVGVHGSWDRAARAGVVLVPGCWTETSADVAKLLARPDVAGCGEVLARAHARGAVVGASCSAAFVVARRGLLDGRRATTTWWLGPELRRRFPLVDVRESEALVVDQRVACAGTVFAMADLALFVVTRAAGPTVARQVMRALLLDAHVSQSAYMVLSQVVTDDESVRRAEAWVRENLATRFETSDLARAVAVSKRTLARRLQTSLGLTPTAFVRRIRMESAGRLLETTRYSIVEIASRVGYEDAGTLRRLLRSELGASPRALRRGRG